MPSPGHLLLGFVLLTLADYCPVERKGFILVKRLPLDAVVDADYFEKSEVLRGREPLFAVHQPNVPQVDPIQRLQLYLEGLEQKVLQFMDRFDKDGM